MAIRARVLFQLAVLLVLVGGAFVPSASASVVVAAISYAGTISTTGTNTVTITTNGMSTSYNVNGAAISGSFTYDSVSGSGGVYTQTSLTPTLTLTVTSSNLPGGSITDKYPGQSLQYVATVTNPTGGGTHLALTGEFNTSPTYFNLVLVSSTTLPLTTLPTTSTITSDFSAKQSSLSFTDGVLGNPPMYSETFTVPVGNLVSLTATTPEPSSLVIVIVTSAVGALGFSVRSMRKRRRAVGALTA
jgi:hypothetical protein